MAVYLTPQQEFSIEIPDKEADQILSGMCNSLARQEKTTLTS